MARAPTGTERVRMRVALAPAARAPGGPAPPVELELAALPLALARLHRAVPVAGIAQARIEPAGAAGAGLSTELLVDLMVGAGFADVDVAVAGGRAEARGVRARTLPDTVGPGMALLACGLNPSVVAADAGLGFAGATNRFWPAALEAGVVSVARRPDHALLADRVGMTDLVKRSTPRASELDPAEYRDGAARVRRLVSWLRPDAVLFVGLDGWRAAVDRRAQPGWQREGFGGAPAYVMPSTSGLNARTSRAELVAHLRAALAGAGGGPRAAGSTPARGPDAAAARGPSARSVPTC